MNHKRAFEFGQYIKGLRKKRGLTLMELSKLSSISQGYLSQIENGKKVPSVGAIFQISKPLGASRPIMLQKAGYLGEDSDEQKRYSRLDPEAKKDLIFVLERDDLTYKGVKLSASERKRFKQMLPLIFPEMKNGKYLKGQTT